MGCEDICRAFSCSFTARRPVDNGCHEIRNDSAPVNSQKISHAGATGCYEVNEINHWH